MPTTAIDADAVITRLLDLLTSGGVLADSVDEHLTETIHRHELGMPVLADIESMGVLLGDSVDAFRQASHAIRDDLATLGSALRAASFPRLTQLGE